MSMHDDPWLRWKNISTIRCVFHKYDLYGHVERRTFARAVWDQSWTLWPTLQRLCVVETTIAHQPGNSIPATKHGGGSIRLWGWFSSAAAVELNKGQICQGNQLDATKGFSWWGSSSRRMMTLYLQAELQWRALDQRNIRGLEWPSQSPTVY